MEREFIWYCPDSSCNNLLLKTDEPFLDLEKSFRCKRCNDIYSASLVMKNNKHNVKKHLELLEDDSY